MNIKITLKKIAQEAGVSQATVSRIVNQNTNVSPELTERVEAAARKLGVELPREHNNITQTHAKCHVVGILLTDLSNPYFQEILKGVVDEAKLLDYGVQVFETYEDPRSEEETFQNIGKFNLDGVIMCASRLSRFRLLNFYQKTQMPIVLVNRFIRNADICSIIIDYEKAMVQATSHLLALGHRRIGYLAGPANSESSKVRMNGIRIALEREGLELDEDYCPRCFPTIEGGFQAMTSLLSIHKNRQPTAILAYNDLVAVGAMRAIRNAGLRIPEDISIIGIDNIEMAQHSNPPLSSISPPKKQMGSLAMRTIYRMNTGDYDYSEGYIELEAPLTLRASTAGCIDRLNP